MANVLDAVESEEVEGEGAEQGEDAGIASDATGIFTQIDIADMVQTVFDRPMAADDLIEFGGGANLVAQVIRGFGGLAPIVASRVEAIGRALDADRAITVASYQLH